VGARGQVETLRASLEEDRMKALSAGTRAAVSSLQGRIVLLENENRSLRETVLQSHFETKQHLAAIGEQLQSLVNNQRLPPLPPPPPPQAHAPPRAAEAAPGAAVAEDPPAAAAAVAAPDSDARPPPPPRQEQPAAPDAAVEAFRAARATDAIGMLRATPRQPALGSKCPNRWDTCLSQWRSLRLEDFRDRPQVGWAQASRLRFNKRLSIQRQVERAAVEQGSTFDAAAAFLDQTRADLSINFTVHLKLRVDDDDSIPKRIRATGMGRQAAPRRRQQQEQRR
jgi:hypothetical protein